MKEPKTYTGAKIARTIWIVVAVMVLLLRCVYDCQAQCTGDNCNNPQILIAPNFDGIACAETVCNGEFPNYFCTIEGDGEPDLCWSQEYDYFVQLQVIEPATYYLYLTSDYTAPPNTPDDIIGGIQMAIYNNDVCAVWMSPIAITPCSSEPDGQQQEYILSVELEAGNYIIQIDGFGGSYGCSLLCVYGQFFLNLSIKEFDPVRNQMNRRGFDVLGRRVW